MIIEYATTEFGVKQPTRSNPSDAGLDIYANLKEQIMIFDVKLDEQAIDQMHKQFTTDQLIE